MILTKRAIILTSNCQITLYSGWMMIATVLIMILASLRLTQAVMKRYAQGVFAFGTMYCNHRMRVVDFRTA